MKSILTTIGCLFFLSSFGQQIGISNSKNNLKIIDSNVIALTIGEIDDTKNERCKGCITLQGSIKSVIKDSITFKATKLDLSWQNKNVKNDLDFNQNNQLYTIHQNDICCINIYKSEKTMKRNSNILTVGGLLMVGGIITSINTLSFAKKGNRKNLLIASGVQFCLGLVFAISSSANGKSYSFKNVDDSYRFVNY